MTFLRACPLVLIVGALYFLLAMQQTKPIHWLRPPAFASDDYPITFTIHIPVNQRNRTALLAAFDGEFPVQVSEIGLAGETRRTIWPVKWRLPAGEIWLSAELRGIKADGQPGVLSRDSWRVHVIPRGF